MAMAAWGTFRRRLSTLFFIVALVGPPLVVTYLYIRWGLKGVDGHELAIHPAGASSFAVFIQLCRNYSEGYGWVQTVVPLYNNNWHWGGHYGPLIFLSAFVSSLLESPWTLARWQVIAVGTGCLFSYLLGWAEAKLPGALASLTLYAASAPIALIALYDYQDITFCLPLVPLLVWASRHGKVWAFLPIALAFVCIREECILLLPLLALTGGGRRATLGLLVSIAMLIGLEHYADFFSGNVAPIVDISQRQSAMGWPDLSRIHWGYFYHQTANATPWFLLTPWLAGIWVAIAAFLGMPLAAEWTDPSFHFLHHLAPLVAIALTGAMLGVTRLMRAGPLPAALLLVAVVASSLVSLSEWSERIRLEGIRIVDRRPHPAWALIRQVSPADGLLVPRIIAPAAARRRFLATEDSLGQRVSPSSITYVIDDGQLQALLPPHYGGAAPGGEIVARSGRWFLLKVIRDRR